MERKSKFNVLCFLICLIFILPACNHQSVKASGSNAGSKPSQSDTAFIIGPADLLEIVVMKEPDLSKTIPVRPDGKILLPLVNEVQAAGKTPAQLQADLVQAFSKFYEQVTVSVLVREINSYKFSITGKVKNPGIYKMSADTTMLEAISLAGGFVEFASTNNIKVFRKGLENSKPIRIKYLKIISGKDPSQNIIIKPGDTIIVP
jgi:polysaccharide export outer membrane protein